MKNLPQETNSGMHKTDTRQRLLEAAERLFAERGYTHTTVAQITRQARCNIAMLHYYFHGKDQLYLAVFHRLASKVRECGCRQAVPTYTTGSSLAERVATAVRDLVAPFLEENSGQRVMKLVLQERVDPHLPMNFLGTEVIKPLRDAMARGLRQVCSGLDDTTLDLCLDSIIAQLLHLMYAPRFYDGVDKSEMPLLDKKRALTHVVAFSTAGILCCINQDDHRRTP